AAALGKVSVGAGWLAEIEEDQVDQLALLVVHRVLAGRHERRRDGRAESVERSGGQEAIVRDAVVAEMRDRICDARSAAAARPPQPRATAQRNLCWRSLESMPWMSRGSAASACLARKRVPDAPLKMEVYARPRPCRFSAGRASSRSPSIV